MNTQPGASAKPTPELLARLNQTHAALLHVHKALLDHERERFEAKHGSIGTPADVLQVVIKDPWFAWLRPMTTLITEIDEFVSSKEPLPAADGEALLAAAKRMLVPAENGDLFGQNYLRTIQESPDVALAHAEWKRTL